MNAINTVWNLMLNRPYNDGGSEFSGREGVAKEGDARFWDASSQKTAARVIKGKLEDSSQAAQWSCEIAISHTDSLLPAQVRGQLPTLGASWRINFSRVEKKGSINWVWSPQVVWSPAARCYQGQVNMHLPDAYGYVIFADENGRLVDGSSASCWEDPAFPARHAAMCCINAYGTFLDQSLSQLGFP